jgi:acyl-coenzyme A synthetase/AMP-(fatty) acid ligase
MDPQQTESIDQRQLLANRNWLDHLLQLSTSAHLPFQTGQCHQTMSRLLRVDHQPQKLKSADERLGYVIFYSGKVCIKLPMPPSFMSTLYNNDKAFIEKYMTETPGYYTTGDAGYFDQDGYLNVMTRLDDIINTAGHRLSTAAME